MKGISFQNGIEFKVHIDAESWAQGDTLCGTLEAKARNADAVLPELCVALAYGTEKKIKQKHEAAFQILQQTQATASHTPLAWKFTLSLDAPISDKAASLYLLYGNASDLAHLAQLKLNIVPHLHLRDFAEMMSLHFRFVLKSWSEGKQGFTDVKFDPPQAKEWAFLESLVLSLKIDEQKLYANFTFHRNEIDALKAGLATKKTKREILREEALSRFIHDFNQRLNKDHAIQLIHEVMVEYRGSGIFNDFKSN